MGDGADVPEVLDTAALLHWPGDRIGKGVVSPGPLKEIAKLDQSRAMLVEASSPAIRSPMPLSVASARKIAEGTGDLAGLSPVDIEILALALEVQGVLATDDRRLQNCAASAGLPWLGVGEVPMSKVWSWQRRCTGCRREIASESEIIDECCPDCGSPVQLKRRRG